MKKVVIFGGGSGLSQLLKGLKLFPLELTNVVTVADNGQSTGRLRKEFSIPAVGDISKVLLAMSDVDNDVRALMNYRFTGSKTLGNHSIKNLLLTALLDLKGDFKSSIPILANLLDIRGHVIPLTEANVDLVGITEANEYVIGEENITKSKKKIVEITYNQEFEVYDEVLSAVKEADLIIISSGSLYTSILPHIVVKELASAINQSQAEKLYICNLVTQPGETDGFSVSDHLKVLLDKINIDYVIANNTKMDGELVNKYATEEQKDPVEFDLDKINSLGVKAIGDRIFTIEDDMLRHDSLKTAYLIFSHLMKEDQ